MAALDSLLTWNTKVTYHEPRLCDGASEITQIKLIRPLVFLLP